MLRFRRSRDPCQHRHILTLVTTNYLGPDCRLKTPNRGRQQRILISFFFDRMLVILVLNPYMKFAGGSSGIDRGLSEDCRSRIKVVCFGLIVSIFGLCEDDFQACTRILASLQRKSMEFWLGLCMTSDASGHFGLS